MIFKGYNLMFKAYTWTKSKIGYDPENRRFSIPVRSKIKNGILFELLNIYDALTWFIKIHKSTRFLWFLVIIPSRNLEEESLKFSNFYPTKKSLILMILKAYKSYKTRFYNKNW